MNLFMLKQNRRRLNHKAVLPTKVKLYAKGERLQGCSPEGFICLVSGRTIVLAFSRGTKYVLAKEKPWTAVLPSKEKKLSLGEEVRIGSPGRERMHAKGEPLNCAFSRRFHLSGVKENVRRGVLPRHKICLG